MLWEVAKSVVRSAPLIALDYKVDPTPRWGFGKPTHPQLEALMAKGEPGYRKLLESFEEFREDFLAIDEVSKDPTQLSRDNGFFAGLDALTLYSFLRQRQPKTYIEIGSGHSTRFASRAIRDAGSDTKIISIDPHPRVEMNGLSDKIVRHPLENVDQEIFKQLGPGDILFFDGSHYALPNSDVVAFFLEVMPSLPKGVLIHVHDIRLPYDYPPKLNRHWFGEQYILAMYLLSTPDPKVVLPNYWIWEQPELKAMWDDICIGGNSFWYET